MKTILSSKRYHYMARVSVFLILVALIAGIVGCDGGGDGGNGGGGESYTLTVNSTTGGVVIVNSVTILGKTMFTYDPGTVVSLNATPDVGYQFVEWTGNVSTISNVTAAITNITMSGNYSITANFALLTFAGGNGTEEDPYQIANWHCLNNVRNYMGSYFILVNDLDSGTAGYEELASQTANEGKGWQPIGTSGYSFTGSFDGQGYEIRDLFINRSEYYVGLFGYFMGVHIKDIGVVNITVNGGERVGGLVGESYVSTVINSYSTGSVSGSNRVGGLMGSNEESVVRNSYSTASVIGWENVGGLVGRNFGTVSNSYSTGSVSGNSYVGGLVGWNYGSEDCPFGIVSNSYSTGSVTGNSLVGGLVGENEIEGTVSNSFWDTVTSGTEVSAGGTGKNTTEMQDITTFSAYWDIVAVSDIGERDPGHIWNIVDDETYPFLSWQPV